MVRKTKQKRFPFPTGQDSKFKKPKMKQNKNKQRYKQGVKMCAILKDLKNAEGRG